MHDSGRYRWPIDARQRIIIADPDHLVVIENATRADLEEFDEKFLHSTVKAIVARIDGEPVALAGLWYMKGLTIAFCDLRPKARPYKKTIHKVAMKIIAYAKARHKFIFAQINDDEGTADRWLRRFGFEPYGDDGAYLCRSPYAANDGDPR